MTDSVLMRFAPFVSFLLTIVSTLALAQENKPPMLRASGAVAALSQQKAEIIPPQQVAPYARPDSVTLKPGSTTEALRALTVRRRLDLAQLRAQPVVTLAGSNQVANMKPVLDNPASAANIAARLRTKPALARVLVEESQVLEVEQGLVIRQFISYQVRTGVCTDPNKRAQLLREGGSCMNRLSETARTAAYADPTNPRYIADPGKRAQAIKSAQTGIAAEQVEAMKSVAQLRTMLQDPAQRARIETEIGKEEANRLGALDDDSLATEMANAAERQIEQVMFVPAIDKQLIVTAPKLHMVTQSPASRPEQIEANHVLPERIFLTGFTLGREYEWRQRVSVTIRWCLVGCKKTYFAEAYAGFGYGFGLRFPIRMGGLYSYQRTSGQESATIAPVFEPIDGAPSDYSQSGLPSEKIYGGKELVAQFNSWAGMAYKLPIVGSNGARLDIGKDFTTWLPDPFTDGQFRPPAPGDANPPSGDFLFEQVDLIGGLANFGVVGAKVFPALKISLTSDRLQLKLKDHISGTETLMASSGKAYKLSVDTADHTSRFSIGDPEYKLAFNMTPGLAAQLWVDVAVWSNDWTWPVWFPQIGITLPPGGATFSCHAQTVCSREYVFSPDVAIDMEGESALPDEPVARQIESWRRSFISEWKPRCPWEKMKWCETAIVSIGQTTANIMGEEMHKPGARTEVFDLHLSKATTKARDVVREAEIRDVENYGKSLAPVYEAVWAHGCTKQICRDRIHTLVGEFVTALVKRAKNSKSINRNQILAEEAKAGRWAERAKQEVAGVIQPQLPAKAPQRIRFPNLPPTGG